MQCGHFKNFYYSFLGDFTVLKTAILAILAGLEYDTFEFFYTSKCVIIPKIKIQSLWAHSVEISELFCHLDFPWNQFWSTYLEFLEVVNLASQKLQKIIKRKI